jgi:hypothetical protein
MHGAYNVKLATLIFKTSHLAWCKILATAGVVKKKAPYLSSDKFMKLNHEKKKSAERL